MYKLSARQILLIALISGIFAAGAVVIFDRINNRLQSSQAAYSEAPPAGISDPATSTDEQNNIEVYRTLSPGVVFIHSTSYARDFFGFVEIKDCRPDHLESVISQLRGVGVVIKELNPTTLEVSCPDGLKARDVTTAPYPEFPTDMQAQYMVLMTQAEGRAEIIETVFENRFMHASELQRMGAQIHIDGRSAIVNGPTSLNGARVIASDLRASASLVIAGLIANGETLIDRVYHIDRGYEKIESKLRAVGAEIERIIAPVGTAQLLETV